MIQVKNPTGVRMDYLSTLTGDTSITIDDNDPDKRAELAKHVEELIREGYAVFVQDGDSTFKVMGYDAEENAWILVKRKGKQKETVKAAGTVATTVPPRAGG